MSRVRFPSGELRIFINKLLTQTTVRKLAKVCEVSERTIRDWKREKFTVSNRALLQIEKYFKVPFPQEVQILTNYWYIEKGAQKGGLRALELYGPPGTSEGRKKGGRISQQRRRENPVKYSHCLIRKIFSKLVFSEQLAEVVGIILGDGNVGNWQFVVYLDLHSDRAYAQYITQLFTDVFKEKPAWYQSKKNSTIRLSLCGVNLINNLSEIGIDKGNKIRRQVDIPTWIWTKKEYKTACVRGLIDTDGGLYFHKHWIKGIKYRNLGLCFTSYSKPLLNSVSKILGTFNIKHSLVKNKRIYVYSLKEIYNYFAIFKSSNEKLYNTLINHETKSKIIERLAGGVA